MNLACGAPTKEMKGLGTDAMLCLASGQLTLALSFEAGGMLLPTQQCAASQSDQRGRVADLDLAV